MVVAPDDRDAALGGVDGTPGEFGIGSQAAPILHPEAWTDASYQERRDDPEQVLNGTPQQEEGIP